VTGMLRGWPTLESSALEGMGKKTNSTVFVFSREVMKSIILH
jgi:hypothetical protein